jgi:hypothetical protein
VVALIESIRGESAIRHGFRGTKLWCLVPGEVCGLNIRQEPGALPKEAPY